jgi:hypothetical protein
MKTNRQSHQSIRQARVSPLTEDTSPVAFFEAVHQAFQRAEQAVGGSIDRFYGIGGYVIRLRFAGPALVPLVTPAFEHLAVKPGPIPALTVCLWDSASTRTGMPPPPWSSDDYIARGEVRGYNDDRIRTNFNLGSGVLSMLATSLDLALWWIHDARQLPYYESAAPLRVILYSWMRNHGRQQVHAAAAGTSTGGVLLVGKGGSGKSTTVLASLDSELVFVSDDYCLLAENPAPLYAYSLYSSAKVDPNHTQGFPHLVSAIDSAAHAGTEKVLLFLHQHYPEKMVEGFPIRAILVPKITGRPEIRLTPTSPMTGLRALAPSTVFQSAGAGNAAFRTMAEIVKQVPCYHLELGTDLSRIPGVIVDLLAGG